MKLGALLSPSVSMVLYSVVGWLDCRPSQSACVSCSAFVVLQDFSPQLRIRMCTGEPVALHVSANNRVCVPSSHGGPISRVLCRLRSVFAHPSSCHPAPLRPMHPNRPCYGRAVCTCEYYLLRGCCVARVCCPRGVVRAHHFFFMTRDLGRSAPPECAIQVPVNRTQSLHSTLP